MSTQRTLYDTFTRASARPSLNERPLREWPIGERPIERLASYGSAALSDAEIIAALLFEDD